MGNRLMEIRAANKRAAKSVTNLIYFHFFFIVRPEFTSNRWWLTRLLAWCGETRKTFLAVGFLLIGTREHTKIHQPDDESTNQKEKKNVKRQHTHT